MKNWVAEGVASDVNDFNVDDQKNIKLCPYIKGQLISVCIFNSPKKRTKKNQLYYYGTSSRIVFVRFLGELKTSKRHFEINWPLLLSTATYTKGIAFIVCSH